MGCHHSGTASNSHDVPKCSKRSLIVPPGALLAMAASSRRRHDHHDGGHRLVQSRAKSPDRSDDRMVSVASLRPIQKNRSNELPGIEMGFLGDLVGGAVGKLFDGVEAVGRGLDAAITPVVHGIADVAGFVEENPGKSALIAAATVATGGAAAAFAGPVAATAGGLGLLGSTATTGTAISTLTGAALTNASLAAVGGGALAAGGAGMAGGTAVIATTGALAGGAVTKRVTRKR